MRTALIVVNTRKDREFDVVKSVDVKALRIGNCVLPGIVDTAIYWRCVQ